MKKASRVLLVREGQIYMMLRSDRQGKRWIAPGGVVEIGESFVRAAIRETAEETGVKIDASKLIPTLTKFDKKYNVWMKFYACLDWVGEPTIFEPDKFEAGVWVDFDKVHTLVKRDEIGSVTIGSFTESAAAIVSHF